MCADELMHVLDHNIIAVFGVEVGGIGNSRPYETFKQHKAI